MTIRRKVIPLQVSTVVGAPTPTAGAKGRARSRPSIGNSTARARERPAPVPRAQALLNDAVGHDKEAGWNLYLQRPCRLEVDNQLKFRWLLNRQIGWLGTLQDFADQDRTHLPAANSIMSRLSRTIDLRGFNCRRFARKVSRSDPLRSDAAAIFQSYLKNGLLH